MEKDVRAILRYNSFAGLPAYFGCDKYKTYVASNLSETTSITYNGMKQIMSQPDNTDISVAAIAENTFISIIDSVEVDCTQDASTPYNRLHPHLKEACKKIESMPIECQNKFVSLMIDQMSGFCTLNVDKIRRKKPNESSDQLPTNASTSKYVSMHSEYQNQGTKSKRLKASYECF